mmetsp:Transcript_37429/g.67032  ORF Transcript_37429/g.67032 Transcript_37429/m.67032 type:complete len:275 (-) Transcript_37429:244-1068(-)
MECNEDGRLSRASPARAAIDTEAYNFCRVSVLWADDGGDDEKEDVDGRLRGGRSVLATAGGDPAVVELWDLTSRERLLQLALPGNPHGMCMALHLFRPVANAPHLIIGYEDGTVALWDCAQPTEPVALIVRAHSEPVMSVAVDSAAEGAVTCAADKRVVKLSIRLSDAGGELSSIGPSEQQAALRVTKSTELPTAGAASVAIRQDRKIFAVGAWSGDVWVYSYKKCTPLARLQYHAAGVTQVAFSDDEDGALVSASRDATLALWRIYPPSAANK